MPLQPDQDPGQIIEHADAARRQAQSVAVGRFGGRPVAIDTETLGLNPFRDRLCLVQLSEGDGRAALIRPDGDYRAPELTRLLADESVLKIFHFGRFDLAVLKHYFGVMPRPVYCTDRKSTRLNSSHMSESRMPSSA